LLVPLALLIAVTGHAIAQDTDGPPPVEVSPLSGPLHQLRCNGNVGVVASIGEDGTLLVDTGYVDTAPAVREALTKLGAGPIRIIVNTHGDGDHVGGNATLEDGTVIFAHPEVRRRMATYFALPATDLAGLPIVTIDGDATIHFNGEVIRLLPMPGGHTAGDMVVHFTQSRIACVGDLVFLGSFPNADPARGGDARRLAEVLRKLEEKLPAETTLVAAHGGALTMAELDKYIAMIEGTTAAVADELAAGRSLPEILERNPLARWSDWENPDIGISLEGWITEIHASLEGSRRQSICAPMTAVLVRDGVDAAVSRYRRLKREEPDKWSFAENELNTLGYQLLGRERVDEAIVIFQLNVEAYPEGFNTYDSLAEAYMVAGRSEEAILNYERSLELNPDNTNAATMLARIRGE
jgi:glyoxylase-like metal-dependent hydrolase (beta-lactamase superfamily II)